MAHRVVLIPDDGTGPELTKGKRVTYDIQADVGTNEVADAIIEKLEAVVAV